MEIKGKYTNAIIYTDVIEQTAIDQLQNMCDFAPFAGAKIRVMPDVHTGTSCTIGTTMTVDGKAVPNMVGVDIGCGMDVVQIAEKELDLPALDALIYARIPSGQNRHETHHKNISAANLDKLRCRRYVSYDNAAKSLGTLGGGNHFIEVDRDDEGNLYVVVHSGSRHLGVEVAEYYQDEAYRVLCGNSQAQINAMIKRYKEQGRDREIESEIARLRSQECEIPKDMAYVTGQLFDDYIHDMALVQHYAVLSRKAMLDEIIGGMGLTVVDSFTTIHNYIDTNAMILRKGAVSARNGEKLLIPINMRDGSLICMGKGNPEWNYSAPHGAGRLLSRGKARATLSLEQFEQEMQGIYTTSVNKSTLDESPMAYKSIDDIVGKIAPTVDILKVIKPIYNFKSSEEVN